MKRMERRINEKNKRDKKAMLIVECIKLITSIINLYIKIKL